MAVNLISNPSWTVDMTGWAANSNSTAQRSTAQFRSTPASMIVTSSAAGTWNTQSFPRIALSDLTTYTAEAWFMSPAGVRQHRIQVDERQDNASVVSHLGVNTVLAAGVWTRLSVTFRTTATTDVANIIFAGLAAAAAGEIFYVDDASFSIQDGEWTVIGGVQKGNLWPYR